MKRTYTTIYTSNEITIATGLTYGKPVPVVADALAEYHKSKSLLSQEYDIDVLEARAIMGHDKSLVGIALVCDLHSKDPHEDLDIFAS